ncbi:hypothetical protein O6H91_20G069400 [Diphasiastrum complanatum]|uniref:Uncharacterized protein n=1 Tax=Diphasiastrum complanatum TaxID=34168 RepID=A0ACC2ARB4_DIPCM|nr:hypothetical protein O6H91_20G069400 [Diphasiastrum complanatum]
MEKSSVMIPQIGPDGIPSDFPIVSYTEKVLEEKELQLRRYIEDNYSKIRNVERELAELAWQVKLTAGPKKSALEHFRKKIEQSTERIKSAKLKEEQAKKVWEAAAKALKYEEDCKQKLCEDLSRLVQESASAQFSRLEELKHKLEALTVCGGTLPIVEYAQNGQEAASQANNGTTIQTTRGCEIAHAGETAHLPSDASTLASPIEPLLSSRAPGNKQQVLVNKPQILVQEVQQSTQGQRVSLTKGRGQTVGRAKGAFILQKPKVSGDTSWTGAGFDVGDVV